MAARRLRAVEGDDLEKTEEKSKKSNKGEILDAVESGDELTMQRAMLRMIAIKLDEGVPPRDLASLTRRAGGIAERIRELEAQRAEEELRGETGDGEWDPEAI